MAELEKRIHDDNNGLDYVLVGDYYIPELKAPVERALSVAGDGSTSVI